MNFKSVLFFVCTFCCTNLCCVIKGTAWLKHFVFTESEKLVKNFYEEDDWAVLINSKLEEKGRNELKDVDVKDVRWFELLSHVDISAVKIEKSDSYSTVPFVMILPRKIRPLLRAISGVDSKNYSKVVYICHELYTSEMLHKFNGTDAFRDCLMAELIQLVDQTRCFNFRTEWDKEVEEVEKAEAEKIRKKLEQEKQEKEKEVKEKEKEVKEKEKEVQEKEKELKKKELEKKLIVSQKDSEIRMAKNSLELEKEMVKFQEGRIQSKNSIIATIQAGRSNGISASEIPSYKPSKNFC